MALLDSKRRLAWAGAAALGALATACVLMDPGPREFAFSHRLHVLDEALDCSMCHEDLAFDDEPGMPSVDVCLLCHEDLDAEKPPDRQVADLFEGEVFRGLGLSRLDDEVVFSHLRHVEAELDCSACHLSIDDNEDVSLLPPVAMADCMDCHERSGQAVGCAACHTEVDRDWAPPNHDLGWERAHGRLARMGSVLPAESCSLCHREDTCASCHSSTPPRSHTAGFRLKGHGLLARMDRASCATCHEPSSCDSCHAETLPTSHTGMWGGTKSLHCLGCHTPLPANGCFTCHKATPSHALAPPKPDWHSPAMDCTACHGRGLPLSHPDNGENCNVCHL